MADESNAFGVWERIGETSYIMDRNTVAVGYRSRAPERLGPFAVEFQATERRPDRRFYPVEVLHAWRRDEPADDYVERVCGFGTTLLPEMEATCRKWIGATPNGMGAYEGKAMPDPDVLRFVSAVFASRRSGHSRVKRSFRCWDDFVDKTASARRPESIVPGIELAKSRGGPWPRADQIIRTLQDRFVPSPSVPGGAGPGEEVALDYLPHRTPLDQVLVHGVSRGDRASSFRDVIRAVAPALIAGIEVEEDGAFLAEHLADFQHFVKRLAVRYFAKPSDFGRWLRRESEKGFVRLLPGFKRFDGAARDAAREKARRFYRRLLWTAYETASRCFGAAALWMWVSFCRSGVVDPSREEQRAFRWYNGPLVCTAGLPIWFFGPNVLRWVIEPFINGVWGWQPDGDFDALTQLIGLYGQAAGRRRQVDTGMKGRRRAAARAASESRTHAFQFPKTAGGVRRRVPVLTSPPTVPDGTESDEMAAACPQLSESRQCRHCGGLLHRVDSSRQSFTCTDHWLLVATKCPKCKEHGTYRLRRPGVE